MYVRIYELNIQAEIKELRTALQSSTIRHEAALIKVRTDHVHKLAQLDPQNSSDVQKLVEVRVLLRVVHVSCDVHRLFYAPSLHTQLLIIILLINSGIFPLSCFFPLRFPIHDDDGCRRRLH